MSENNRGILLDRISMPNAVPLFSAFGLVTVLITFTFASCLNPVSASAITTNSPNSSLVVTLPEVISLRLLDSTASSDINNLVMNINPTPNGAFTKGSLIADVSTSNATGYKLYMTSTGKDHSTPTPAYTTDLVNTNSAVDPSVGTIPTLALNSSITESEFKVSNSTYTNKWGYSLNGLLIDSNNNISENTNPSSITYTNVPANGTNDQIQEKSVPAEHGRTPITFGVNATSGKASGTYKNIIEITAIANPIPYNYSLLFDQNTANLTVDMPEDMMVNSIASSHTFTIPSNAPISAANFKEWNMEADGSGTSYNPGDDVTLAVDSVDPTATNKTLYADWYSCDAPAGGFCDTNGHVWTGVIKTSTWDNIGSPCPSGFHVPTKNDYFTFLGTSAEWQVSANLTNVGKAAAYLGISGDGIVWSSTVWPNSANVYSMRIQSNTVAFVNVNAKTHTYPVICTK